MTEKIVDRGVLMARLDGVEGPARIPILSEVAWKLRESDPDHAVPMAGEACRLSEDQPPEERHPAAARALLTLAWTNAFQADFEIARDQLERADAIVSEKGARSLVPDVLLTRGYLHLVGGEPESALDPLEECLGLYRAGDDESGEAGALFLLGRARFHLGALEEAEACFIAVEAMIEEEEDPAGFAWNLLNLSAVRYRRGGIPVALRGLHKSLEVFGTVGSERGVAFCEANLSRIYRDLSDTPKARGLLERSLLRLRSSSDRIGEARILAELSRTRLSLDDRPGALEAARESLEISRDLARPYGVAEALDALGQVYLDMGRTEEAIDALEEALRVHRETGNRKGEADCQFHLGTIRLDAWASEDAARSLESSLEIHRELANPRGEGWALFAIGRLRAATGDHAGALEATEAADGIASDLDYKLLAVETRKALSDLHRAGGRFEEALDHRIRLGDLEKEMASEEANEKVRKLKEFHEAEQARREALAQRTMNDRLSAVNRDLRELVRHLRRMNEEKNEVLGVVAHDLRSPLTGIQGWVESSAIALEGGEMERVHQGLNRIRISARRLEDLVNDLLEASLTEQGKRTLSAQDFDLEEVTAAVVEDRRASAEAKGLELAFEPVGEAVLARGDPRACYEIVDNLVSNALKFSVAGSRVEVRSTPVGIAGRVSVVVRDEGPGIPEEERRRLFRKFTRLSPKPTAKESSTGLGLYISKMLASAMDGDVSYDPAPSGGSTFALHLPGVA